MTRIISTVLLGAGLLAGATTLPSSEAHQGHEGHDHGPVTPQQVVPNEQSPGVVNTPPPFETLENAPAESLAIPERSYEREPAPSTRDWRQPYDRRFQTTEPPATPSREYDVRPRLQTAPRALEQHPGDRQVGPRTYEDVRPQASPLPGCDFGCSLVASNVDLYGKRSLPSDIWSCPQASVCGPSAGPQVYRYFDDGDCHANEVVHSYYFGDHDHSYSYGYRDRY